MMNTRYDWMWKLSIKILWFHRKNDIEMSANEIEYISLKSHCSKEPLRYKNEPLSMFRDRQIIFGIGSSDYRHWTKLDEAQVSLDRAINQLAMIILYKLCTYFVVSFLRLLLIIGIVFSGAIRCCVIIRLFIGHNFCLKFNRIQLVDIDFCMKKMRQICHPPVHSLFGWVNRNSLNKRVMALYSVAAARISLMSMDHKRPLHSFGNDAI